MDTTNLPKTRKEAQETGAAYYFTGEPCKHGHIAPRKTKGACVECLKIEWQKSAVTRAEYFREYNRKESVKDAKHEWYMQNREAVVERAKAIPLHLKKQYQSAWKAQNTIWVRADTKARRRKHRHATPPWLTQKQKAQIRHMYQIAITMTKTTGEQYVVDHIYPLRSDEVCGLHVPWNLRVITQAENLRKSNTLPDDSEALAFSKTK
jgi:5-methylcytosine-specific restriction endonuclease McrA